MKNKKPQQLDKNCAARIKKNNEPFLFFVAYFFFSDTRCIKYP